VTVATVVAIAAALVAVAVAVMSYRALRQARATMRTLEVEIERGKATFDEVVAHEAEQRGADLERTLALARAESMAALAEDQRRFAEERRTDVAERERDASEKLAESLIAAQHDVEMRIGEWTADLSRLQDLIRTEGITTVFSETLVSAKTAQTLAGDLGIRSAVLDPIEGLSDRTAGQDYLSLMHHNLHALENADGCR